MRGWWWIALFALGAGCDDDDAPSLPVCEERGVHVSVSARGDGITSNQGTEVAMAVVRTMADGEIVLEEQIDCAPENEGLLQFSAEHWDEEAWLPPLEAEVRVIYRSFIEGDYAVLRTSEGALLWEGGTVVSGDSAFGRFRLDGPEGAPSCGDECFETTWLRVSLQTDEGEVAMVSGERRIVTIEGALFVAVVGRATEQAYIGCDIIFDVQGGPSANAYLARTTPIDLTFVERADPGGDDCPVEQPNEWGACSTRAALTCPYQTEEGCGFNYECSGCFWRLTGTSTPVGVDCGHDPQSCLDDGCPEESSCTECPCEGWTTERWRCVWPGDACPPCE